MGNLGLVMVGFFLVGFLFELLNDYQVAGQGRARKRCVPQGLHVFAGGPSAIFVEVDDYPCHARPLYFNDRWCVLYDDQAVRVPVKELDCVSACGGNVTDLDRRLYVEWDDNRQVGDGPINSRCGLPQAGVFSK